MPWIAFLSHSRSVRISEDKNRYYTSSGQCTESNCVRMYIVHCLSESNCAGMYSVHGRVMVDNMYEFQQQIEKSKKHEINEKSKQITERKKRRKKKEASREHLTETAQKIDLII